MIKPKILAVAGGSASGKSSIVKLLAKEFESDLVVIIIRPMMTWLLKIGLA